MTLDYTLPLWGLISFLTPTLVGFGWWLITLHFEVRSLKKTLHQALSDIDLLEASLNTEVKTIHASINEINSSLQQINTYLKLLLDGKIMTK